MFSLVLVLCVTLLLVANCESEITTITPTAIPGSGISSSTEFISTTGSGLTTEYTKISPEICRHLSVMEDINIFKISGTWYEFARRGYGTYIQNVQCLQMDITYMNGTAIVNQTYAANMSSIHDQKPYEYIIQYSTKNVSDYSILSTTYNYLPVPTFKILDTDYDNYLIICSYLPEWEQSAAAFVYFRDRQTADNDVFLLVRQAAIKYADLNGMNLVYQGEGCTSDSISLKPSMGNSFISLLFFLALKPVFVFVG